MPQNPRFTPINGETGENAVVLTVDEYEAVRLTDKDGFSQEECGSYMKVARTTVQQIYAAARKKMADALADRLEFSANATCDHHHDGGHAHTCGEHGCGK